MTYSILKADTAEELTRKLNGMVLGKRNLIVGPDTSPNPSAAPNNLYKHPVSGLTLIFTAPVLTVTFLSDLTSKQIVDAINTAAAATIARLRKVGLNGEMVLALWDDTTPITLSHTGTANDYFGFSTVLSDPALVQTPVTHTNILSIIVENLSRQYVAFIHTP
jgi:hypothetical protein